MKTVGRRRLEWSSTGRLEVGELATDVSSLPPPGGSIRLGHLSDLHKGKPLDERAVSAMLDSWLADFRQAGVDLVVLSGDLVEEPGDRVGLLHIRHLLEESGLNWMVVPGNHDLAAPTVDAGPTVPFFDLFGAYPRVERHAGIEVVLLNSLAEPSLEERTPFERLDIERSGALSTGRVGERQLRTAAGLLSSSGTDNSPRPRVLVVHHHLRAPSKLPTKPPASSAPPALMIPCRDADRVLEWAARHNIRVVFHGHQHAHWPPYTHDDRLVLLNSGSSTRGRPVPRARLVDVTPDDEPRTVWELAYEPA